MQGGSIKIAIYDQYLTLSRKIYRVIVTMERQ